MLNYKHTALLLLIVITCCCCKGPFFAFDPAVNISPGLWKDKDHLTMLYGGKVKIESIEEVLVYKAVLSEKLVEQNSVSNFLLVNEASATEDVGMRGSGYSHQLYLFVFKLVPRQKIVGIYLATSYNVHGKCIGLGPAYIGEISDGEIEGNIFQTNHALEIKKENDRFVFSMPKKKIDSLIRFYADINLSPDEYNVGDTMRFTKVIQGGGNKISGDAKSKRLVFHPADIFKDENALAFILDTLPKK